MALTLADAFLSSALLAARRGPGGRQARTAVVRTLSRPQRAPSVSVS